MKGLRLIRESRGMTQSEAARMLGLSRQAYGNYEHGKRQADYDTLLRIAEILQCSVDALLGRKPIAEQLLRIPDDLRMVPVLAHLTDLLIPAGQRSAVDYIPFRDPDESDAGLLYAVQMEGDSMFPKIEHGDYLLIRQQDTAESGELIAVFIENCRTEIRRYRIEGARTELTALNPYYPPLVLNSDQTQRFRILGVIKAVIHRFSMPQQK